MALDIDYRLPKSVTPEKYEITLRPDFDTLTFKGRLALTIIVNETTSEITMNSLDLVIEESYLLAEYLSFEDIDTDVDEYSPLYCSSTCDEASERVTFTAPVDLNPGPYTLICSFSGILNDKLRGFYKSAYLDEQGTEHIIATTQFEQTDARRAFPCFDEPDFKAVFSISLEVPQDMMAISNSKEINSFDLDNGYKRVSFADTIKMSTYLVAFIVGHLEATPYQQMGATKVRVVCTPGKLHLTDISLDVAEHALQYFENYFDLPYPGDKLDLIAIPDFAAGAMENLGCVTFREAILLADKNRASRPELERLAEVVEHELAHMWFGDLVTMKWWNGIWLNEAFATFMSMKCQTDFKPAWRPFDSFARERAAAFSVDALHGTRPIEIEVHHPDDAAAMFDVLTYEKGASVLWMIEQYLGEDTFRAGIRQYLQLHQLQNTETHDLWDALEEVAGDIPVRTIMDSFIFQGGFPLLSVRKKENSSADSSYQITQEPFSYLSEADALPATGLIDGQGEKYSGIGRNWLIPAIIATNIDEGSNNITKAVIGTDQYKVRLASDTVIANSRGTGYYRSHYDDIISKSLLSRWNSLTSLERFCFISDYWNLVLAKKTELKNFIGLITSLETEDDPHVWSIILGALSLISLISSDVDTPYIQDFIRSFLRPQIDRIKWKKDESESEDTSLLRASLISSLGNIGEDEKAIAYAREIFTKERNHAEDIDQNIFSAVLDIIAAHADDSEFDSLLTRSINPIDPIDQKRHLNALARIRNENYADILHKMSADKIRSQDAPFLLGSLLSSRQLGVLTWNFISDNYQILAKRFPDNAIDRMLSGISGLACAPENQPLISVEDIASFIKENVKGGRQRLSAQNLERLIVNRSLARHLKDQIRSCLP